MPRSTVNSRRVISAARRWLGTPYHDHASVRGAGCDCLGLVRGVRREAVGPEPLPIPPCSRDWGETGSREVPAEAARRLMIERPVSDLAPGALAKHCGILSSPDRFIHACERTGVTEEPLTPAWRRRIVYQFLFPTR